MVATLVGSMVMIGLLSTLIQSRRLTESSIYQNTALTVIQGYIEQVKNMEFLELPYYNTSGVLCRGNLVGSTDNTIYTQLDSDTMDPLAISPGSPPDMSTLTPGVTPEDVIDNVKLIDLNETPGNPNDDLEMNIWVWVNAMDNATASIGASRSITMIYTWEFRDGGRARLHMNTLRTIRSAIPTF